MGEEVRIDYDDQYLEITEKIGKLLKAKGLKLKERWEDTSCYLSLVKETKSTNPRDMPRESQFEYKHGRGYE